MLTLYQFEDCPYCAQVRQKLSDLCRTYLAVCVPRDPWRRRAVIAASGQAKVPVLVDGPIVLTDEDEIVRYLARTYGESLPGAAPVAWWLRPPE